MQWTWLGMVVVLGCASLCWSAEPPSPYAGQEQREIKALSTEEIAGYLSGSGMGLAKVAELHHYPGPRHVLDLAEPLQLSAEQRQKTQSIFEDIYHRTLFGFDHRIGHLWPLSMTAESSNATVLQG